MTNQKFRAALFDMDDTLIDRQAAYEAVYRLFYDQQDAVNSLTPWAEAIDYFWSLSPNNAHDSRSAIEEIQNKWPDVVSDAETHYRFYFSNMVRLVEMLPGVEEFVKCLNDSEISWGIVTNGDQFQHQKAENTGLDKTSPFVLASKLFGVDKPAPEIFLEAVRLLDVKDLQAHEVLFVGDNPYTDILGANAVGMKTAWICMGREFPDDVPAPDYIVEHVSGLKRLLI
ncbi:MAG: HAD-IA family hydrolase [SAR202 cluster bacterium]|nr:HAD-IA family hydrolase [SAR202 cluster bacterium]|tara:strand:- start:7217 stop:7897 length:681 start_codon:yes stop_codon:yes gene_type:complete